MNSLEIFNSSLKYSLKTNVFLRLVSQENWESGEDKLRRKAGHSMTALNENVNFIVDAFMSSVVSREELESSVVVQGSWWMLRSRTEKPLRSEGLEQRTSSSMNLTPFCLRLRRASFM